MFFRRGLSGAGAGRGDRGPRRLVPDSAFVCARLAVVRVATVSVKRGLRGSAHDCCCGWGLRLLKEGWAGEVWWGGPGRGAGGHNTQSDHKAQSLDARDRGVAVWDLHRTFLRGRLPGSARSGRCRRWFSVRRASAAGLRPAGRVVGVCRGSEGSASIRSRSKVLSDGERPLRGLRLRLQRRAAQISRGRRGERASRIATDCARGRIARRVNSGMTAAVPVPPDRARGRAITSEKRSGLRSRGARPQPLVPSPLSLPDHRWTGRRRRGRAGARRPAAQTRPT